MMNKNLLPFERNRYFYGKMLTVRDFELEQQYFNDKRRLVNRSILGAGIVCGMGVNINDDTSFVIESGLALDYQGREIVIGTSVFQKLVMLQGFEKLEDRETAYLCVAYKETNTEPVGNISAPDVKEEQHNKIEEGFTLYLDVNRPDYATLYGEGGQNGVITVYSRKGVDIVMVIPATIIAGEAFQIKFIIVKSLSMPPASFSMEFVSDYIKNTDGESDLRFSYQENPDAQKHVTSVSFNVKAADTPGVRAEYTSSVPVFSFECGDSYEQNEVHGKTEILICKNRDELNQIKQFRLSTLNSRLYGGETPIYLAKIDFAAVGNIYMLRNITPHPFSQHIDMGGAGIRRNGDEVGYRESFPFPEIRTEVETLKYWQKPEVTSVFSAVENTMLLHFGIPSSEAYDYATSSGIVEIPLTGSIRINARYVSDEIQHLLGLGNVSINLSVDYGQGGNRRLLFGNGDVFKNAEKELPKVQTAAILYPEKGTFQVGVWLLDHVDGQSIRIHWFAMKTTRDTAEMRMVDKVSIKVTPEFHKTKLHKTVQFKAFVFGTADKSVVWSVTEEDGGTINQNGTYKAPGITGTYEIKARSAADLEVQTSAFVIVEE